MKIKWVQTHVKGNHFTWTLCKIGVNAPTGAPTLAQSNWWIDNATGPHIVYYDGQPQAEAPDLATAQYLTAALRGPAGYTYEG